MTSSAVSDPAVTTEPHSGRHEAPAADPPATEPPRSGWRRPLLLAAVVAMVVGIAVTTFAWPAARTAPRDVPIGVVAAAPAVEQFATTLQQREPGGFGVTSFDTPQALRDAIGNREVYGGFELGAGVTTYTSTAASPAVAQLLGGIGQSLGPADTPPGAVVDVVAAPANDPRGAAFASALLPLVLAGEIAALLMILTIAPGWVQSAAITTAAALAAAMVVLITQTWLDVLPGNGWATWAALSLLILAVAATTAGLNALLGRAGVGLAAIVMVFFGSPFAGITSAPELLPQPAHWLGQLLPPGAGANLVRSVSYFDGAAALGPMTVLAVWAVLGLGAISVGRRLGNRGALAPLQPAPVPAAA